MAELKPRARVLERKKESREGTRIPCSTAPDLRREGGDENFFSPSSISSRARWVGCAVQTTEAPGEIGPSCVSFPFFFFFLCLFLCSVDG